MTLIKIALSSLAISLLAAPVLAQEGMDMHHDDHSTMDHSTMDHSTMDHSAHAGASAAVSVAPEAISGEVVTAKVNGLVCDFCVQTMTKVFGEQDAVQTVDVNLDSGLITLGLKPGASMDDATIGKLVRDSGYALVEIERTGGA
jgi:copper chaperone CopZ